MKHQLKQLAVVAALIMAVPGFATAQGPKACRVQTVHGQYIFSATGHTRANLESPWVPKAIIEVIDFNGDGTVTVPAVTVANPGGNTGLILDRAPGGSGSYSLNDDCTGTLQFSDGVSFKIYVSPRGHEIWLIQMTGLGGSLNVFQGKAERVW